MADTYSYVSGELRCALFPLFVDGILRNTNKKKCSKWSHQSNFAHFLVSTRPNLLLFSNKRKTVKIGQNAFTLNQGDTPLPAEYSHGKIYFTMIGRTVSTWCAEQVLAYKNREKFVYQAYHKSFLFVSFVRCIRQTSGLRQAKLHTSGFKLEYETLYESVSLVAGDICPKATLVVASKTVLILFSSNVKIK